MLKLLILLAGLWAGLHYGWLDSLAHYRDLALGMALVAIFLPWIKDQFE